MHDLQTLKDGGYRSAGLTKFKLTCPLETFPDEILELGATLEQLDLSDTGLSSLPANLASALPNLKVAFFSNCNFSVFPRELASCPHLEMVAFRSNGMVDVPEDALPPRLRWLILTDNRIERLPASIGRCTRLQKCMLAGNRLRDLPSEMAQCTKLGLLRLSANQIEVLPPWLFTLPELAFLSFARNPCVSPSYLNGTNGTATKTAVGLADISWADLEVQQTLGEGASGIISQGLWKQSPHYAEEVAIKLFRGALTSDGTPADEMAACLAAGAHESLITVLGRIHGHPEEDDASSKFQGGLVMQLIPPHYTVLGSPPSLTSCTRDCYPEDASISASCALSMLTGVAGAAAHLHAREIMHGDLYAHNILASRDDEHALLGDFGAATIYSHAALNGSLERLEVLAFAHLIEDMLGVMTKQDENEAHSELRRGLEDLHSRCSVARVDERPTFEEILGELEDMMGWRGMMRIPG
ncbi:leucine-rich repeat-containing protein 28 [Diplogelasinospora grovesii]|uniref:Leucine-rich repeat-containing protein 28 n=1 Tax=Diplogelasinospora grovesii TaxID=303347 RepID=A0AAN6NEX1_9PEZI|nr:leucine-rich repeat-containing protein 28 [Diplogelasinospora grovesii]